MGQILPDTCFYKILLEYSDTHLFILSVFGHLPGILAELSGYDR